MAPGIEVFGRGAQIVKISPPGEPQRSRGLGALSIAFAATVTGGGRSLGVLGLLVSVLATPWILTRVLEYFSGFVG